MLVKHTLCLSAYSITVRVRNNIRGMELHEVGLYKEPGLAAAGAADYQDIFIPGILWVLWAVRHHQPLRLGQ